MATKVAQFDVTQPGNIWALESYRDVFLLIRRHATPLGSLSMHVPPGRYALTAAEIFEAIESNPLLATRMREQTPERHRLAGAPVSVVICTRDRVHALRRCLQAVQEFRFPVHETIVVDGSAGDATARLVASGPFRYLRQDGQGLQAARNIGLREASSDIVAFVDDDAVPDPWWPAVISATLEQRDIAAVTGLVLPAELWCAAQHVCQTYGTQPTTFQEITFDGAAMEGKARISVHQVGSGTNMAVRKSALETVGMFDTALDAGTPGNGRGEFDLFYRLLKAGLKIRYQPEALVWHYYPRDPYQLGRILRRDQRARGAFLLKLLHTGSAPRKQVLSYMVRDWMGEYLAPRLAKSAMRRIPLPRPLAVAEWKGALESPWAYWRARGHGPGEKNPAAAAQQRP